MTSPSIRAQPTSANTQPTADPGLAARLRDPEVGVSRARPITERSHPGRRSR
jgi:hypothetical protein